MQRSFCSAEFLVAFRDAGDANMAASITKSNKRPIEVYNTCNIIRVWSVVSTHSPNNN